MTREKQICRWCKRPVATIEDSDAIPDSDPATHLCWRWWNPDSDCHGIEIKIKNAAPDILDALKDLVREKGGGKKQCGHDFDCICSSVRALRIIELLKLK